jgi:hypothetical protein
MFSRTRAAAFTLVDDIVYHGVKENRMFDEYFYYTAHQEEIIKGHLDEFVSIMGSKVLGYYKTHLEGVQTTVKQFPKASHYFIQKCLPVGAPDDVLMGSSEGITIGREWTP